MFIQDPASERLNSRIGCLFLCELRRIHFSFIDAVQDAHDIGIRHRQAGEELLEESATDEDWVDEGSHDHECEVLDLDHWTLLRGFRPAYLNHKIHAMPAPHGLRPGENPKNEEMKSSVTTRNKLSVQRQSV